jgi:hypothetical protein
VIAMMKHKKEGSKYSMGNEISIDTLHIKKAIDTLKSILPGDVVLSYERSKHKDREHIVKCIDESGHKKYVACFTNDNVSIRYATYTMLVCLEDDKFIRIVKTNFKPIMDNYDRRIREVPYNVLIEVR